MGVGAAGPFQAGVLKPGGGGGRHRQVGKNACRWNVAIAKRAAQRTQTSLCNFISPPQGKHSSLGVEGGGCVQGTN